MDELLINVTPPPKNDRNWAQAMRYGFRKRCPKCGQGGLFSGYLKAQKPCTVCGLDFSGHRADDFPPYVTISIVGHIVLALALIAIKTIEIKMWMHFALWIPLTLILTFWLMAPVKGAIIGLQWAHKMHGFSDPEDQYKEPS